MKNALISLSSFFEQLNPEQYKAVMHAQGPVVVIAGPGSGKTRVTTARILNLIVNKQVDPRSIVALTFTNKAAQEMKDRIAQFLPAGFAKPYIGTFHAYCMYTLRLYYHQQQKTMFSILDSDDQQALFLSILKRTGNHKRINPKHASYQISILKNNAILPGTDHTLQDPFIHQLYQAYEEEKRINNVIDFDDLLIHTMQLFKTDAQFKKYHQAKIRHILVDEYQDTNHVQHALLKEYALDNGSFILDSLCAVGDEDQSIYSWRGATVENMLNFSKDFPATERITIEQNYRSAQPILDVANALIKHNRQRSIKNLWSTKKEADRVRHIRCLTGYQEGDILKHYINHVHKKNPSAIVAILYRAHYQSRSLEESLLRNTIAYTIIGGIKFYERQEIKDILAYLRLIINPHDRVSFFRVINCPARGLGQKFEELFQEVWQKNPESSWQTIAATLIKEQLVTGTKKQHLQDFIDIFASIDAAMLPSVIINTFIEKIGYINYLKDTFEEDDARTKVENIKELLRATAYQEQQGLNSLELFLHDVSLMQEKSNEKTEEQPTVQLMTLHAAKGLEFEYVMLAGLEEGLLPSSHAINERNDVEEERRLFYVGITRAKEYLLITNARYRTTFGTMNDQESSRFLPELSLSNHQSFDGSSWTSLHMEDFFNTWFGTKRASSLQTFTTPAPSFGIQQEEIKEKKSTAFRVHQSVKHAQFCIGIITAQEERSDGTTFLSIRFRQGLKKISAKFIESV